MNQEIVRVIRYHFQVKEKRIELQQKRMEDIEVIKEKITLMKKYNIEIKKKIKEDQKQKLVSKTIVNSSKAGTVREQLEAQQKKIIQENKIRAERVRKERQEALERRKSLEKEFIDHINYQYHIERKEKIKCIWSQEEELKRLEEQEKQQIEKLHKTMAWEQQQT